MIGVETEAAPAGRVAHPRFISAFAPRQAGKGLGAAGGAATGTSFKGAAAGSAAAERREQDFSDLRDSKAEVVRTDSDGDDDKSVTAAKTVEVRSARFFFVRRFYCALFVHLLGRKIYTAVGVCTEYCLLGVVP